MVCRSRSQRLGPTQCTVDVRESPAVVDISLREVKRSNLCRSWRCWVEAARWLDQM